MSFIIKLLAALAKPVLEFLFSRIDRPDTAKDSSPVPDHIKDAWHDKLSKHPGVGKPLG